MDGIHDLGGKQGYGPVRYTLNALIPRYDWREPLTQRSFVEPTFQEPCTILAK